MKVAGRTMEARIEGGAASQLTFDPTFKKSRKEPLKLRHCSVRARQSIESAAVDLFLEAGYEATSIDAIAQRAMVSKATIYSHFGDKFSLFKQVVESFGPSAVSLTADGPAYDAQAVLGALARRVLDVMTTSQSISMARAVIGVVPRHPCVGTIFHIRTVAPLRAAVVSVLDRLAKAGTLDIDDIGSAADAFLGMLAGDFYLRRLLDQRTAGEEQAVVARVIAIFLGAYRRNESSRALGPSRMEPTVDGVIGHGARR